MTKGSYQCSKCSGRGWASRDPPAGSVCHRRIHPPPLIIPFSFWLIAGSFTAMQRACWERREKVAGGELVERIEGEIHCHSTPLAGRYSRRVINRRRTEGGEWIATHTAGSPRPGSVTTVGPLTPSSTAATTPVLCACRAMLGCISPTRVRDTDAFGYVRCVNRSRLQLPARRTPRRSAPCVTGIYTLRILLLANMTGTRWFSSSAPPKRRRRSWRLPLHSSPTTTAEQMMKTTFSTWMHSKKLDSWIPADDTPGPATDNLDLKLIDFLFSEADKSIDFDNFELPYDSRDSAIPLESTTLLDDAAASRIHAPEISFDMDFSNPSYSCYSQSACNSFTTATLSQSVSSSSVGVVNDGSSGSASETSHPIAAVGNIPSGKQPNIVPNDRVARVLRYQEKRRNRNFKKTVRYASRKAYAETRPRVKGRFTKRGGDPE